MKVAALLSVRDKSTRFPGKVMKQIKGQTLTEHLVDRLKMASQIEQIIIATSTDSRDDVFASIAKKKQVDIYRGSRKDKLKRYLQVADHFELDAVIIIDGDDILCFPEFIDLTVSKLKENNSDVVFTKDLPLGAASSGLTRKALRKVMELKDEKDTEIWGGYFTQTELFKVSYLIPENKLFRHPEIRMTIDYNEDFDFLKAIFDELYIDNKPFNTLELMNLLVNVKPDLNKLTESAQVKYEQNISKAAPVKFKERVLK